MKYFATINDQTYEILVENDNQLKVGEESFQIDLKQGSKPEHFSLIIDGRSHQIWVERTDNFIQGKIPVLRVHLHGYDYDVSVMDERKRQIKQLVSVEAFNEDQGKVIAPMPGLVVKVLVKPGQKIVKGEGVLIVEAMKMENEIRSPLDGEVKEIRVKEKQAVEKNEILAIIK